MSQMVLTVVCGAMPALHRESGASRSGSLQIRFKGDCAIPIGSAPEPEATPFVDDSLPFAAVDNADKLPPGDDNEPFPPES